MLTKIGSQYAVESKSACGFLHIYKDLHAYITERQVSLKIASLLKEML